jgi:opacity protein-like surface antigen
MFNARSIRASIFMAAIASPASAQDSTFDKPPTQLELRSAFSVAFIQTRPQGAFGQNVGLGYGLSGAYLFRVDRAGILSIRADLGVVDYGNTAERVALSSTVGGRVQVNVRTTNYIIPVTVGPQLMWPTGRFRPYVNAGVGGQGFVTESRVESLNSSDSFASTTNQSDVAGSWSAGGGIYAAVYSGKTNVSIDLGVQYMNGGNARYLSRGSIVDLPDGTVSITPLSSATHLMVVRAGLRVGL